MTSLQLISVLVLGLGIFALNLWDYRDQRSGQWRHHYAWRQRRLLDGTKARGVLMRRYVDDGFVYRLPDSGEAGRFRGTFGR